MSPVAEQLFADGGAFDFFQALRLLERLAPDRRPVGHSGPPLSETVRLRAHVALDFPASAIYEARRPTEALPVPALAVNFLGMAGPSGILPRHYTELLLRLELDVKGPERYALRDWLDLFNHRLLSLFYRAWEKYRFYLAYERGEHARHEPDPFTRCLFSLIGMGTPTLRNRLRVSAAGERRGQPVEQVLARIDDLALLRFSGFFAHRPRCASSLESLLRTYLKLPVEVQQFQGRWLRLDGGDMSALGSRDHNNAMGVSVVVGDRVWDVQGKIRVRLGPLGYERFLDFLPDPGPVPERKAVFLLAQLVRLYTGVEIALETQLVLKAAEVPACRLGRGGGPLGSRLGWNTWSRSKPMRHDADDAVFAGQDRVWVGGTPAGTRPRRPDS